MTVRTGMTVPHRVRNAARHLLAPIAFAGLAMLPACSVVKGPRQSEGFSSSSIVRPGVCIENDEVISLRKRLSALASSGVSATSYGHAKAQCWLDSAESLFFENDRTGYVSAGIGESTALIRTMESDKSASAKYGETKHIAASDRVRDDLWQLIAALKSQPGFDCAAASTACAEIKLVRAGHANAQTGWRQANPHVRMAERLLAQAQSEAGLCAKPVVTVQPPPAPVLSTPPPPTSPVNETFSLQADALFQFNRGDRENLLPEGKAKLDWLVARLKEYQRIDKIDIAGFTDRLGAEKYNQALSQSRANTVRDYLISGGIKASVISAIGRGKSNTSGSRCPMGMERKKLIDCLQADRRVELSVLGIATRQSN